VLDDLKEKWTEERKEEIERFKFEYYLLYGKNREVPLKELLEPFKDF